METSNIRLGDCVTCNPSVKLEKGKECPVIDIDKITVGRKFVENKDTVIYNGQGGAKFENGDTLMARITPCLENGKMAQARIDGKGIGSTELFVFRGKEGITDNEFVYYLFKQQHIRDLAANSMSGASGRQRADLKFIKKIKLDLPTLPTQRRIASILSAYDNLIENNNKRIRLLEQMAENLYKEWFVRFRFPGHEKVEMENGLPKGWKVEKVQDWCRVFTGKKDVNQTVPNGKYAFFSCSPDTFKSNDYIYDGKAILVAGNGSYTGRTRYFEGKFDLYQRTYAVVSKNEDSEFLYYLYTRFKFDFEKIYSGGTRGSAIPYIVMRDLTRYRFLYEKNVVKKYTSIIRPLFRQIDILNEEIITLSRQRALLLPRLMSGKLEVKE